MAIVLEPEGAAPRRVERIDVAVALPQPIAKTHGGGYNDIGLDVKELSSGGYIVVGHSGSQVGAGSDVYLLRADANGNMLWTRTYGGDQDDWGDTVWETSDGGFMILGGSRSFFPGAGYPYADAYVIRTNSAGDTLWTKTYSNWDGNDDFVYAMTPTSDGGYVMVGTSFDRVWLVKINSAGTTLWSSLYEIGTNEYASSIKETSDGGYTITGSVKMGPSATPRDFFLFKVGSATGLRTAVPAVADQFYLNQNYPNPFNPATTITFALPEAGPVTLEIFDISGRRIVGAYGNTPLSAGWHAFTWDGRNDAGVPVASGMYLYRLQAGDLVQARRMLLLR